MKSSIQMTVGTFSNDDGDDNVDYKINFYLSYEFREWLDVFSVSNGVKIIFITGICGGRLLFPSETFKMFRRVSHSRKCTECSDFTLLFYRGRLRNVPSFYYARVEHYSAH